MSNRTIKTLYVDYNSGDHISTPDLKSLVRHFRQLEHYATLSGDQFSLMAKEARRVADGAEMYLSSRMICISVHERYGERVTLSKDHHERSA